MAFEVTYELAGTTPVFNPINQMVEADQVSKIKKVYSLEEMHHRYAENS